MNHPFSSPELERCQCIKLVSNGIYIKRPKISLSGELIFISFSPGLASKTSVTGLDPSAI